jgi:hypothetical protein
MRETCVRITDKAEDANFLARPFMIMLAELLCRIFGKIEDLVLLWRAGLIPPPAPKPARIRHTRARKARKYTHHKRHSRRTPGIRPQSARTSRPDYTEADTPRPAKPAPVRRIDRYPKPQKAKKSANRQPHSHANFVTV